MHAWYTIINNSAVIVLLCYIAAGGRRDQILGDRFVPGMMFKTMVL